MDTNEVYKKIIHLPDSRAKIIAAVLAAAAKGEQLDDQAVPADGALSESEEQ